MGNACARRVPTPSGAEAPLVQATPHGRGGAAAATGAGAKSSGAALGGGDGRASWHIATANALNSMEQNHRVGLKQDGQKARLDEYLAEVLSFERRRRESTQAAAEVLQALCGPEVQLVKSTSVNGRLLFVVDGAVPEDVHGDLYQCLQTDAFRRTEFARPDTREFRHHVVEYIPEKLRRTDLFAVVDRLVKVLFPTQELEVYRMYTNAVMFGDAAFVHRDSSDSDHVTALVYPNPEWASELGGETVFYYEDNEIAEAVEPRAGRICLFHGNILHKGSPPSRLFWGSRYTTAFKFAPVEGAPPKQAGGAGGAGAAAGARGGLANGMGGTAG